MSSAQILTIIITGIISTAVTFTITFLANKLIAKIRKDNEKETAIEKGVQALLRSNLYQVFDACIKQGYVTSHQLANWENMYENYHNLGKNGVMDRYNEELRKLPLSKQQQQQ